MRRKLVAGNWKMNIPSGGAVSFAADVARRTNGAASEAALCVPFTEIPSVLQAVKDFEVSVGAQNMHFEDSGAFTGEISAAMLAETGVKYVIIGHSERRQFFAETDENVNKKVLKSFSHKLTPIICVGENLTQREQGVTADLVRLQVKIAFQGVSVGDAAKAVIAYEPVWAIGTGKTATSAQAQEVCKAIRQVVSEIYDKAVSESIRILYGGSVNAGNAAELFSMPDVDGGLVGGASLKAEFADIVNCVK